jgi:hypothetical protein
MPDADRQAGRDEEAEQRSEEAEQRSEEAEQRSEEAESRSERETASEDGDQSGGEVERESGDSGEKSGLLHKGEFTAPSVGPHTVIERPPPEERLDFDRISSEDAMGRDKRRTVVGGRYGPTRARVFATFAAFFAVVAALAVGFYLLAKELDQPPKNNPDEAPWSQEGADQQRPRPLQ